MIRLFLWTLLLLGAFELVSAVVAVDRDLFAVIVATCCGLAGFCGAVFSRTFDVRSDPVFQRWLALVIAAVIAHDGPRWRWEYAPLLGGLALGLLVVAWLPAGDSLLTKGTRG